MKSTDRIVLHNMGYLCLIKYLQHLTILLLAATSVSLALLEAQEPESRQQNDAVPPLWQSVPGNLDYPVHDNKISINPWNYLERLRLYKNLLRATSNSFTALGPKKADPDNILWGLPLQHGWQYITGRLGDPTNATTCGHKDGDNLCISVHSWWACMNYYLAVVPFLGALESGVFGELAYEVEMLPPDDRRADFCHSVAECNAQAPQLMATWRAFFKYLLSTTPSSEIPAAHSFSQDEALNYMWKAHILSIAHAHPKFRNRLLYLSGPESEFGKDWATTVDFIGATHFPTDQNTTNYFQTGLPPQILLEADRAPSIADFTSRQNRVLFLLGALRKTNSETGRLGDPTNATTCGHKDGDNLCISVHSWWACMNYYLAVVPFLGALESGVFGELAYEVEMLPPDDRRADFCRSVAECNAQAPQLMATWRAFFKYLLSTTSSSEIPAAHSFSQDEALNYMWKARVLSDTYAFPKFRNRLPYLSGPESKFGKDWATTVDFIGATHFPTDQNTTNYFQTGLPPRILLEADRAPSIADFTSRQNRVLFLFGALRKANSETGNLLLLIWRKAMSTEEGRKNGRRLIEIMF